MPAVEIHRTQSLARYLAEALKGPVEVLAVWSLGDADDGDVKGFGYGVPFAVRCRVGEETRELVVARTRPVSGFGHDYPADRAWQALFAHGAYNTFPRHARSLDVGCAFPSGELVSVGDAVELFQLVEKVEGRLYRLALARFLASAHAMKHAAAAIYHRRIRELVGHGECLMGILDSYPHSYAPLPQAACEAIERAAIGWRWRLRDRTHRLSRTHGDFHPWNILFRDGADFSVLDRSRGEWGEPADDVAASHDQELEEVLPPFFAFRAFVLAHPRWYPSLDDVTRARLIAFGRALLAAAAFRLASLPALLAAAA